MCIVQNIDSIMPQVFQVLRCYKCLVFQVHQTKKSIKWECKLCGEKQSIKRNYGIGTGKDCRVHVQKLNSLRGEIDEYKCSQMRRNGESDVESDDVCENQNIVSQQVTQPTTLSKQSKWCNYVEEPEVIEDNKEPMCLGDADVVLEKPKKKRKMFQRYSSNYSRNRHYTKDGRNQNNDCDNEEDKGIYCKVPKLDNQYSSYRSALESKVNSDVFSENQIKEILTSKLPVKHFVPPLIKKDSKWAQFAQKEKQDMTLKPSLSAIQSDKNTLEKTVKLTIFSENQIQVKEHFKPKMKKFVPPVINKNSKWAQFAQEEEEEHTTLTPSLSATQSDKIFALCDESDLDTVLNL